MDMLAHYPVETRSCDEISVPESILIITELIVAQGWASHMQGPDVSVTVSEASTVVAASYHLYTFMVLYMLTVIAP